MLFRALRRKIEQKLGRIRMSTVSSEILPPSNQGMKVLDRSLFHTRLPVVCVVFKEPKYIGQFAKNFKQDILRLPGLPYAISLPDHKTEQNRDGKSVVLDHRVKSTGCVEKELSEACLQTIKEWEGTFVDYSFDLDYEFWRADQILRSILPADSKEQIPSGFSKTGHLAHMNLREEFKPYASIIGQVIIDKNPSIKTVVDKLDTIDTTFRTFKMKVIAGEDNFMVEQLENKCKFHFDFSKVYWNSRLSTEHERLVGNFVSKTDAICDVMGGVGPFAIPAAKKLCVTFANDLNPESYKYLKVNIQENKVEGFVQPFNTDGKKFIWEAPRLLYEFSNKTKVIHRTEVKVSKTKDSSNKKHKKSVITEDVTIPTFFAHYIMNLPDSAITFLSDYVGLFTKAFPDLTQQQVETLPGFRLPTIHVYHFEKFSPDEPEPSNVELCHRMHAKVVKLIGFEIAFEELEFHNVRAVSPTKPMYCISFRLPSAVAFRR
ncbi:unnamed protein product [Kuraishia capsulata CBS 1993]|uniref:tRNA (guanine(37)-N1)-methyltransferase n=1 Tax=Kuraishia capsulata CBS 1993 TaxID=1382522 RepID=W6MPE0_9ASCO|nr:uncharacterized protein KUCA_T00004527001 [Kuraishia capsulata CBS 1993]CDK28544.1 unnamed protein product [Kuraishia capsulata CBS 1993]